LHVLRRVVQETNALRSLAFPLHFLHEGFYQMLLSFFHSTESFHQDFLFSVHDAAAPWRSELDGDVSVDTSARWCAPILGSDLRRVSVCY